MEFLFRADGSPAMGSGHLMRCLALAEALMAEGHRVHLAAAETTPGLERRYQAAGIALHRVDPALDGAAAVTRALVRAVDAAAIVVDGFQFDPAWRLALREAGRPVLAFSDATPPATLHADLAVDAAADPADLRNRTGETHWLLGTDYLLLRRELVETARLPMLDVAERQAILVVFGGTDPAGLTLPVTHALAARLPAEIDVVIGGGVPDGATVAAMVAVIGRCVRVHHDPAGMGTLMRRAGLAVSAGGGTLGELAAHGVPVVTVIVADNQIHGRPDDGPGWARPIDGRITGEADRIAALAAEAWADLPGRVALAARGRRLVDARGAQRLAAALVEAAARFG